MESNKKNNRFILVLLGVWILFLYYADAIIPELKESNYEISIILFSIYCLTISDKDKWLFYFIIGFMALNIIGFTLIIDFAIKNWIAIIATTLTLTTFKLWHQNKSNMQKTG